MSVMTVEENNIVDQMNEISKNLESLDKKFDERLERSTEKRIEIQETLAKEGLTPSVRYKDVKEALCLPDDDDLFANYQWRDSKIQECLSLIDDTKKIIEQRKEDSSLDELHQLTQEILNRDISEEETNRFSKENLESLIADVEAIQALAERRSKTLPEIWLESAKKPRAREEIFKGIMDTNIKEASEGMFNHYANSLDEEEAEELRKHLKVLFTKINRDQYAIQTYSGCPVACMFTSSYADDYGLSWLDCFISERSDGKYHIGEAVEEMWHWTYRR